MSLVYSEACCNSPQHSLKKDPLPYHTVKKNNEYLPFHTETDGNDWWFWCYLDSLPICFEKSCIYVHSGDFFCQFPSLLLWCEQICHYCNAVFIKRVWKPINRIIVEIGFLILKKLKIGIQNDATLPLLGIYTQRAPYSSIEIFVYPCLFLLCLL